MRFFASILMILLVSNCSCIRAQIWTQKGLDIEGEGSNERCGESVALNSSGSIVAVGAPSYAGEGSLSGSVRVYAFIEPSSWVQLGSDIDGEVPSDENGASVALNSDGSIVAIGGITNDGNGTDAGHVRVYSYDGSSWNQLGNDIDGESAGDYSGYSISLSSDGETLAIGALFNDGNGTDAGHVRIYTYDGSSWNQLGNDIDGESPGDYSGYSVSLSSDGQIIAIGAPYNDGNGTDAGHVRVYYYDGSSWNQLGNDIDGEAGDFSGNYLSISADGETVAIGAPGNDNNGVNAGLTRVYTYDGSSWNQLGNDIDGEGAGDNSGEVSLSSDGGLVAVAASGNDGNGTDAGHVRVYTYDGSSWNQLGNDIDGESAGDYSGISVSLSSDGGVVAIGASYNDENGTDAGHVRVYETNLTTNINQGYRQMIKVSPNPSDGEYFFNLTGDIRVFDMWGTEVYRASSLNAPTELNLSNLSSGIYFLQIYTEHGTYRSRLVKK